MYGICRLWRLLLSLLRVCRPSLPIGVRNVPKAQYHNHLCGTETLLYAGSCSRQLRLPLDAPRQGMNPVVQAARSSVFQAGGSPLHFFRSQNWQQLVLGYRLLVEFSELHLHAFIPLPHNTQVTVVPFVKPRSISLLFISPASNSRSTLHFSSLSSCARLLT